MLVVGDLDDVFLPKPADLLVSLTEARACLENLLSRLADMFKDNHNVGNAMSSALQAAYKLIVSMPCSSRIDVLLIVVLAVTDRRQDCRTLSIVTHTRTWSPEEQRRPEDVWHIERVFSTTGSNKFL